MAAIDKKELWVDWTHDAMANFSPPEDLGDRQEQRMELAAEMADVATTYADEMLAEYEERFDSKGGGKKRRRRRDDDDDDRDET